MNCWRQYRDPISGGFERQGLIAGEHLFAQTVQTFRYLAERVESGEIALPNGARMSVDAFVNEKALSRVLRAMKTST